MRGLLKNIVTEAAFTKTMNEMLTFFRIVPLVFNPLIPASFPLVEVPLKLSLI